MYQNYTPDQWFDHIYGRHMSHRQPGEAERTAGMARIAENGPVDFMRMVAGSNEAQLSLLGNQLTGGQLSPQDHAHFSQMMDDHGIEPVRSQLLSSPWNQNHLLGDGWLQHARNSTAGINAMPFVQHDFAGMVANAPWSGSQMIHPQSMQGYEFLQGLLQPLFDAFSPPKKEEEDKKDKKQPSAMDEVVHDMRHVVGGP